MNIEYIAGYYDDNKNFIPLTFYKDSVGDLFAGISDIKSEVFTTKKATEEYVETAKENNKRYGSSRNDWLWKKDIIILEVDTTPLTFDNMSDERKKEYMYHKLKTKEN